MREFAEAFYSSSTWQECRQAYSKSQGYLCERCKAKGIIKQGEIVHHKVHLTPENINDPEITTGFNNLQLLCRDCHAIVHKPTKRFKVDATGRVSAIE